MALLTRLFGHRCSSVFGLAQLMLWSLATLFTTGAGAEVAGEPRHALVIGNAAYASSPLLNPANDATAVAKALERAGFKVDLRVNANLQQMQDAVTRFGDELKQGGAGLFYYAGHGVQIKGRNFLMPVGIDVKREDEVPYKAIDVQQVLDKMETAKNRINMVVLDACRDNPFAKSARSASGGLSQVDAPIGSLIAFATAPGSVASDGRGSNGLYTQHLLANIERPGTPIEDVFKRVRLGVRLDSNGSQVPWESTSLEGDFYFFPAQVSAKSALQPTLAPPPGVEQMARAERGYELLRQNKLDDAERIFRALVDSGHVDLAWMGREGLAEVRLARGDAAGALADTSEIIAKAPTRSAAYLTRSRALAASGKSQESQAALLQAAGSQTSADFAWQKADALVAAGNAQRKADPAAATKNYERAVRENPQSVAALSNLAVTVAESGKPDRAKALLERAQAIDPADPMTAALIRQMQQSLADQQDSARQKYIDDSVKELAARFKGGAKAGGSSNADDWTSPVMALSVLPFQDASLAGLGGRIGMEAALQEELIRELQNRGFTLVERRVLDKVLAEVRLGSSELADQDTQIRLGKVLAARLIVSGTLTNQGAAIGTSFRAIDTETTQLALVKSERGGANFDPTALAVTIAKSVSQTVQDKYPLKGRIVGMDGERAIINLGRKHGVVNGQSFNVLTRGEPIELNGRVLGYKENRIAQVTVTEVQDQLAFGRVSSASAALEKNQRIIARSE